MKEKTCCFTGHRRLHQNKVPQIIKRLNDEIENLVRKGVTVFISGGSRGFDQIAAALIIAKKKMGYDIRLLFALPCQNQDELWSDKEKSLYHNLLAEADDVHYVSEEYYIGCMKKRNQYMVDQSDYCICALLYPQSGTSQTVGYAQCKGLHITNVAH